MATLSVWKFPKPNGAEDALRVLNELQAENLIVVEDGAWVAWEEGKKKPKTHR